MSTETLNRPHLIDFPPSQPGAQVVTCSCTWSYKAVNMFAARSIGEAHVVHETQPAPSREDRIQDAKRDGIQRTMSDATADEWEVFLAAVRTIDFVTEFSINDIRNLLERGGVDLSHSSGFFRTACSEGHIEPVTRHDARLGKDVHEKVPSTGMSAKGAHVGLYRRKPGIRRVD